LGLLLGISYYLSINWNEINWQPIRITDYLCSALLCSLIQRLQVTILAINNLFWTIVNKLIFQRFLFQSLLGQARAFWQNPSSIRQNQILAQIPIANLMLKFPRTRSKRIFWICQLKKSKRFKESLITQRRTNQESTWQPRIFLGNKSLYWWVHRMLKGLWKSQPDILLISTSY